MIANIAHSSRGSEATEIRCPMDIIAHAGSTALSREIAPDHLDEAASLFASASKSLATRRAYHFDWVDFVAFCERDNATPAPPESRTVCRYFAHLVELGRAATTIDRRGMLVVVVAGVSASDAFDVHTRTAVLIFFAVALVLMAMAPYAFDREGRIAYLAERHARLLNAELQRVARTDPLTGLWNRRHLQDLTASAWNEARVDAKMAVLLVDVDHFKRFNDTFGHVAGDACLAAIGQLLAASIGAGAAAVRFGGEEFLLFLPNCDVGPALALAELVCAEYAACTSPTTMVAAPG